MQIVAQKNIIKNKDYCKSNKAPTFILGLYTKFYSNM